MYRLVLSDLDGTLLNGNKQISKRTIQAVNQLAKKGILFVPATGRLDVMTKPYLKFMQDVNLVIGCDGAMVRNVRTGEILYENTLSADACRKVFEICRMYGLSYYIFTRELLKSIPLPESPGPYSPSGNPQRLFSYHTHWNLKNQYIFLVFHEI